ncbi:MAG: hypothetical protein ABL891_14065, partial [Burkholderiales bacterium]
SCTRGWNSFSSRLLAWSAGADSRFTLSASMKPIFISAACETVVTNPHVANINIQTLQRHPMKIILK